MLTDAHPHRPMLTNPADLQGGEACSPHQVHKDQHSLHGAQLCQVRENLISYDINGVTKINILFECENYYCNPKKI